MPRQISSEDANLKGQQRKCHLLLLIVGLGCVLQATLNVSLRLSWSSRFHLDCNKTCATSQSRVMETHKDCDKKTGDRCNRLQERFNVLQRERDTLRNTVSELKNFVRRCV